MLDLHSVNLTFVNQLPTFIKDALNDYRSHRAVDDEYVRYKALETVCAITIKYVGTTLSLIASHHYPEQLKHEIWNRIFRSSSLGGWLDAAEMVCKHSASLPNEVRDYCREYTLYREHPNKGALDDVSEDLEFIVKELKESYGYKIASPRSSGILRALRITVELRNKSAHGALKITFFNRIEDSFFKAIRQLLTIIPFSVFVFRGKYGGSYAVPFIEPGSLERRERDAHFWVDSELLKEGFCSDIPFLSYREDSKTVYFLNSGVDKNGLAEYIDYRTGNVTANEVGSMIAVKRRPNGDPLRPRYFEFHSSVLASVDLIWSPVSLSSTGASNASEVAGVYVFTTSVNLGDHKLEVILYVGKTKNLHDRIEHYLRVKQGYDTSRPEIAGMFKTYRNSLLMKFARLCVKDIGAVERAIYETTMPEYNLIAPTATLPQGDDE